MTECFCPRVMADVTFYINYQIYIYHSDGQGIPLDAILWSPVYFNALHQFILVSDTLLVTPHQETYVKKY